jgi:hypothetical protein
MLRNVTFIVAFAIATYADAGSLHISIHDLNGKPITDQFNRTFELSITTSQGKTLTITRFADGEIQASDSNLITLRTEKVDDSDPNKPTFTVEIADAVFRNSDNVAVTLFCSLSGRTSPGQIRNILGPSNTTLHLAFPIRDDARPSPCCPDLRCCPPCMRSHHCCHLGR